MKTIIFGTSLRLSAASPGRLPCEFEGIGYSGALVFGNTIIDLATTKLAERMPVLSEHRRDAIIGHVTSAKIEGNRLLVAGKLYADIDGTEARGIAERAKRGAPYQLSVGLFGYSEEYVGRNQSAAINGAVHVGPLTVLRGGLVRECSIVTLGADHAAKARLFGHGRHRAPDATSIYAKRNAADKFEL